MCWVKRVNLHLQNDIRHNINEKFTFQLTSLGLALAHPKNYYTHIWPCMWFYTFNVQVLLSVHLWACSHYTCVHGLTFKIERRVIVTGLVLWEPITLLTADIYATFTNMYTQDFHLLVHRVIIICEKGLNFWYAIQTSLVAAMWVHSWRTSMECARKLFMLLQWKDMHT